MKRTKKSWLFLALQIVFMLVIPCVLIWLQYGNLTSKYKISVTGIFALILIFWVFKRIFLNKWIKGVDQKIVNIETNSLSITDIKAIESNKSAWRMYSILQLLISLFIPILLGVLSIITIKTVEEGLIKLYGCLMFCAMSIFIGVIFRVAEIFSMRLTHEKK